MNRVARADAAVVLTRDDSQYPVVFVFDARRRLAIGAWPWGQAGNKAADVHLDPITTATFVFDPDQTGQIAPLAVRVEKLGGGPTTDLLGNWEGAGFGAFNEVWGMYPRDSQRSGAALPAYPPAQRSLGHEPPETGHRRGRVPQRRLRSTKSGVCTPETVLHSRRVQLSQLSAQRSLGHEPQRQSWSVPCGIQVG